MCGRCTLLATLCAKTIHGVDRHFRPNTPFAIFAHMLTAIQVPGPVSLHRFGRSAMRSVLCVLLAIVGLTGARGAPVSAPHPHDCRGCPASAQLDATSFDLRLPFLTGSGALAAAQLEAPPRTARLTRSRSIASDDQLAARVRTRGATAVRVRIAGMIHATISRTLAVAHAGPAEARSTPPPSVS